jgi:hypothetical protein
LYALLLITSGRNASEPKLPYCLTQHAQTSAVVSAQRDTDHTAMLLDTGAITLCDVFNCRLLPLLLLLLSLYTPWTLFSVSFSATAIAN